MRSCCVTHLHTANGLHVPHRRHRIHHVPSIVCGIQAHSARRRRDSPVPPQFQPNLVPRRTLCLLLRRASWVGYRSCCRRTLTPGGVVREPLHLGSCCHGIKGGSGLAVWYRTGRQRRTWRKGYRRRRSRRGRWITSCNSQSGLNRLLKRVRLTGESSRVHSTGDVDRQGIWCAEQRTEGRKIFGIAWHEYGRWQGQARVCQDPVE